MATQDERIRDLSDDFHELAERQAVHDAEDRLLHQFVRDVLMRLEAKVDKIEKRLDDDSDEAKPPRGKAPRWWDALPDGAGLMRIGGALALLGTGAGSVIGGGIAAYQQLAAAEQVAGPGGPTPQPVESQE